MLSALNSTAFHSTWDLGECGKSQVARTIATRGSMSEHGVVPVLTPPPLHPTSGLLDMCRCPNLDSQAVVLCPQARILQRRDLLGVVRHLHRSDGLLCSPR